MAGRIIAAGPSRGTGWQGFHPTVEDVLEVKRAFSSTCLPPELVDMILDAAEYWPRTSQATRFDTSSPSGKHTIVGGRNGGEDVLLLRCCPLGFLSIPGSPSRPSDYLYGSLPQPKLRPLQDEYDAKDFNSYMCQKPSARRMENPCRKIVFTIVSRDQGWGGIGTPVPGPFAHSYTWFEIGLERFEKGDDCRDGCKDSSPDPSRPLSQSANAAGNISPSVAMNGTKEALSDILTPGKLPLAPAPIALSRIEPPELSLCHLRPVIPPLREATARDKTSLNIPAEEEAFAYEFPLLPDQSRLIQLNKRASRLKATYEIAWRYNDNVLPGTSESTEELVLKGRGEETGDGKFVRSLKTGDVVTVWGKARFPGWANHIDMVRVDVYWAL